MKKLSLLLATSVLLATAPFALAKDQDKSQNHAKAEVEIVEVAVSPSASPIPFCNPLDKWFNHGAYVSCVAHLHQGGKEVSEAARSDIGKKFHPSVSPSTSPSSSPSASPSLSPSPSPTASSSAPPSPVTSSSPLASTSANVKINLDVRGSLTQLTAFLQHLAKLLQQF